MAIDVKNLSRRELDELIAKAEKQKERIKRERKEKVRKQLTQMAKAEGYTIEELFGGRLAGKRRRSPAKGTKVPPKYRNPSDPAQTWSGRGKRPRWFSEALARGSSEKDLLV